MLRKFYFVGAALAMTSILFSSGNTEMANRMELVMGTLLQIEAEALDKASADKAVEIGFKEARRIDELLSNYKENSEVSRINREAYPESTATTQEMIRFLSRAQDFSEETAGAFDILVEPLTRIWGLRERKLVQKPEKKVIGKARLKSSPKVLEIYTSDSSVRFLAEGAGIDTGGIGKGYALDRALEKMIDAGVQSATLNFGGEVLYFRKKDAKGIAVAVKDPFEPERIWGTLALDAYSSSWTAVSTSANYERFVTVEVRGKAKKLGHILNPKTGEPVENEVRSVTVVSKNGMRADALSTAIFVMGVEEGRTFASAYPEDWVLILFEDGGGNLQSFMSGKWKTKERN